MSIPESDILKRFVVAGTDDGQRIDHLIDEHVPEISRSAAARLIRAGHVTVAGLPVLKPSHKCDGGALIEVRLPAAESSGVAPQDLPVRIVYQDDDIAVIDKDAG
ncbi:MAG TPA: S4 domain-containing protein, partial [Rhodothermales bacterium]|nr:S4 domain-containing protein [Rhodothermales bacterium]